jgi:ATP-dependent Clp protease protease subunit
MSGTLPLSKRFPGGCFLGFNAAVDRRAAEQLVAAAAEACRQGYDTINLCLSSQGLMLHHAHYAQRMLEGLPAKLITWNLGSIQGGALLVYIAGKERYAIEGASFLFNQAGFDPYSGRLAEPFLRDRLKFAQHEDHRTAEAIALRCGRSPEEARDWQANEMMADTDEALRLGIVHELRALAIPADAYVQQVTI